MRKEGISMNKKEIQKEKVSKVQSKKKQKVIHERESKSTRSYILLWILFVLLLGVVVGLGVLVYQKKKALGEEETANISIPITKVDSHFSFNINAYNLSSSDEEYVFRVSNYKNDEMASPDLTYSITIQNPTGVVVKLTKGDDDKDLMIEQKSTVLGSQSFSTNEKEDIYYHISVVKKERKVDIKELISVIITSS